MRSPINVNTIEMNWSLVFCRRDDVELRPMVELKDLEKANSVWSARSPATLQFLQQIAKYNPNIGAFKSDGTLVSWILQ